MPNFKTISARLSIAIALLVMMQPTGCGSTAKKVNTVDTSVYQAVYKEPETNNKSTNQAVEKASADSTNPENTSTPNQNSNVATKTNNATTAPIRTPTPIPTQPQNPFSLEITLPKTNSYVEGGPLTVEWKIENNTHVKPTYQIFLSDLSSGKKVSIPSFETNELKYTVPDTYGCPLLEHDKYRLTITMDVFIPGNPYKPIEKSVDFTIDSLKVNPLVILYPPNNSTIPLGEFTVKWQGHKFSGPRWQYIIEDITDPSNYWSIGGYTNNYYVNVNQITKPGTYRVRVLAEGWAGAHDTSNIFYVKN